MLCALYRKERAGDLKPGGSKAVFRKFIADTNAGRIVTIPYGVDVAAEAETLVQLAFDQPKPIMVRSLDVIHVSSALAIGAKALVATDARLRRLTALTPLEVLP